MAICIVCRTWKRDGSRYEMDLERAVATLCAHGLHHGQEALAEKQREYTRMLREGEVCETPHSYFHRADVPVLTGLPEVSPAPESED